jgi:DNA repair protein RecN (Recombination protein N)
MRSILGSVGFDDALAEVSESCVSWQVDEEATGFENEETNIFKQVKKEKVRYFLNAQSISKKALHNVSKEHLRLLSLKDFSDFEQANMLTVLDQQVSKKEPNHLETIDIYRNEFYTYQKAKHELEHLLAQEKRMQEHKEFAEFELAKIDGKPVSMRSFWRSNARFHKKRKPKRNSHLRNQSLSMSTLSQKHSSLLT